MSLKCPRNDFQISFVCSKNDLYVQQINFICSRNDFNIQQVTFICSMNDLMTLYSANNFYMLIE